jgi:antitoxin VapB
LSLNIKDAEAHQLAQAIAKETGETMTHVVVEALRAKYKTLEKRKSRATIDDLRAIADRSARLVTKPYMSHAELLYDDNGLPK